MTNQTNEQRTGTVAGVNGPVVDVAFEKTVLPKIREALSVRVGGEGVQRVGIQHHRPAAGLEQTAQGLDAATLPAQPGTCPDSGISLNVRWKAGKELTRIRGEHR